MVISFAEVFTDAGFQKYLIQHEFASERELEQSTNVAFWTNLSFSALVCVLIFFFRHPIAAAVGNPSLGNAISIASVNIILVAFSSIQMARYKRDFDFKTLFLVRIGTALIPVVNTIPLAILLRNFWALLIGTLAGNLFNAVVLTALLRVGSQKTGNVDNWAAGGLAVGIENDGSLKKFGFYKPQFGQKTDRHPDSGIAFAEFKIPMFEQAVELVCTAHKALYGIHSIGWDVAFTQDGPLLIEENDNWEISLQQACDRPLKAEWETTCK